MVRKMRNVHPGEILKMELIDGRKFSISKIAELLDTPISDISNVLNGNVDPANATGNNGDFYIIRSDFSE